MFLQIIVNDIHIIHGMSRIFTNFVNYNQNNPVTNTPDMNFLKKTLSVSALAFAISGAAFAAEDYAAYVNPFIGTTNFGTTNPGAVCPNGMMAVVPFNVMGSDTNLYDKDSRWWSTPYEFNNKFFTGYAHVALSGVGCPELSSLLTMATTGDLEPDYKKYGSAYVEEKAMPGYFSNRLTKYDILTEVTATKRTAAERYTFPGGKGNLVINLGEGLTNESGATVRRVSPTEIEGSKLMGTFCYNSQAVFPIYFVMRVSKPASATGFWKMQPEMTGVEKEWTKDSGQYKIYSRFAREISGDDIGAWWTYDNLAPGEQVEIRLGVSFVSCDNARENLDKEQASMTFDQIRAKAHDTWNADLGRIRVTGGTRDEREVFYTALYHTLIHPNVLSDVNGQYPMMEGWGNRTVDYDGERYTVFSLWDTYRNFHQLMTLVYPERQLDMVRSMVDMSKEWGWLPKWELYSRETFTMEGDPAIPVIIDTWRKGLRDFDMDAAYKAMVRSATTPGKDNPMRPDIDPYIEKGYIPLGTHEGDNSGDNSVSHALEYYVADNALAWLAGERGDKELARTLRERAAGWRNYYSKESGTLRPLNADGSFLAPFNPRQGENFEEVPGFHEGSAWNYTFFVPHDVKGLVKAMGGNKAFTDKLVKVFRDGLYDPANEPDIAYPYLFSQIKGEEWRTSETVDSLLHKFFTVKPDGIPGNDDTGTMSAWAVFSMMGFYPDIPGVPEYTLVTPTFDRVTIELDPAVHGNDRLVIEKEKGNKASITLDGRKVPYRISHADLVKGKKLKFTTTE